MHDVLTGVRSVTITDTSGVVSVHELPDGATVSIQQRDGIVSIHLDTTTRTTQPIHCPARHRQYGITWKCVLTGPHDVHASGLNPSGFQWRDGA